MRVLEYHYDRLSACQYLELPDQCLQCIFLLSLRTEVRQRVALRSRQRHEIGEECHILIREGGACQQRFELFQLGGRRVIVREPRRAAELIDERIERAVLVKGRAEIAQ
jgi:hypothetical protein